MQHTPSSTRWRFVVRRVFRLLAIVAIFVIALTAAAPDSLRQWWDQMFVPAEQTPVTVYPYNFTGHAIQYVVSPGLLGYLPTGAADGHTVLKDGYVPPASDAPLPIRWRYADSATSSQAGDGRYTYGATVSGLRRPSDKNAVLVIRFYPDGEVAARYTTQPDVAAAGQQVGYSLPGEGWKQVKPAVP